MSRVRLTKWVEGDLDEIWAYIARDNPLAADAFVGEFIEAFELLGDSPRLGRARRDLGSSVRQYLHRNYVIYYRTLRDGVEILRVLHGAREQGGLV
jgi:toxin ParE1/3/4